MVKAAVITGGALNIGKGITKILLKKGFDCFILDSNPEAIKKLLDDVKINKDKIHPYIIDIGNRNALLQFAEWFNQGQYKLEVLINNAAFESTASVMDFNFDESEKTYRVNLEAAYFLTSWSAEQMKNNTTGGNIIFITSTHTRVIRTHPLYSASKAALKMYMEEASLELAEWNIRVNAIEPGGVVDSNKDIYDKDMPLGEVKQSPSDIAEGVAYLISQSARFVTGHSLTIDAGFSVAHTHYWKKRGLF